MNPVLGVRKLSRKSLEVYALERGIPTTRMRGTQEIPVSKAELAYRLTQWNRLHGRRVGRPPDPK